jgi:hypothetical protein
MKMPRMSEWLLLTLLLLLIIWFVAPQQVGVSLYKLSLITMGGVVGYWFDRRAFPSYRPGHGSPSDLLLALIMIRRAMIIGAAIIGVSLGV